MHTNQSMKEKTFRIIAFLFGLTTLAAQFVIMMKGAEGTEIITRVVRFFSFMTILTNILVALAYILPLSSPSSKTGKFFAKPDTQSAILVYISIVSLGYHFLLAKIWNPQGLQYWVDKSLHYAVPAIYLLFYLLFVKKGTLAYNNIYKWLLYPFMYLVYAITRGLITNDYPYPFLDFSKHDASRVFTIITVLFIGYIAVSLLIVLYDRVYRKKI
ncbi:hypothetical protein FRZ67_01915 [Panacibacter ginsenosidivorans]|uniref:Pr6Pr family membrane protein n=1 Tax=Panacibacter ginsenosidivorans TaxID=1813871 RepID=A0A5B8V4K3_9BACT|nr:Pr6Pr family membrane protein [Panacibacter ginsenosidivorans]QEC66119.1 hypothetical protein FRZ67_01915 [Panacibacter ginsenosidivorans]